MVLVQHIDFYDRSLESKLFSYALNLQKFLQVNFVICVLILIKLGLFAQGFSTYDSFKNTNIQLSVPDDTTHYNTVVTPLGDVQA